MMPWYLARRSSTTADGKMGEKNCCWMILVDADGVFLASHNKADPDNLPKSGKISLRSTVFEWNW